ncbi:MAG: peptidase C1A papain [Nitrosomonadales bacterium]|nr:peptidase C1A papain [Nitrosomonadales bacterium]
MNKKASKTSGAGLGFVRNVVPDHLDLRDRSYQPAVGIVPGPAMEPKCKDLPVLHQGDCNGCTGFALSSVVYHLLRGAGRKTAEARVSPFMLYSMARRYDEFPGNPDKDTGSSLRGAMKGWYKHGACADKLWDSLKMPTAPVNSTKQDWWLDAVRRPLGAYYRVDTRSVTDMHVALNEAGILYASAVCHSGWDTGLNAKAGKGEYWAIPAQKAEASDGGHAFAIVGYNSKGFIIHNSWGKTWGSGGRAILTYEDWLDNAMDCWVAQIGVVTELHEAIAQSPSLRVHNGKVQLASERALSVRELSPFIIDMENNGRLSNTGNYRTQDSDLDALVNQHLEAARKAWGLSAGAAVDIAIYAHGGLTTEGDAADTAAKWVPALYDNQIFPIFLMWETGPLDTLKNRVEDLLRGQPRPTAGIWDATRSWYNERLERLFVKPGSMMWGEMKQNADALSIARDSGGVKLYQACQKSGLFADPSRVRLHLVGHSAGSIVHSHIIERLGAKGWNFETVNFMAPAVRVDVFRDKVLPAIKSGKVKRYHQFHLDESAEQKDPTCKALLGYSRSLLYLVAQSFENGVTTPILGMQKYFDQAITPLKLKNVSAWSSPGTATRSTTHGGFDDDETTRNSIIALIKGKSL